jgi:hypothetical protein
MKSPTIREHNAFAAFHWQGQPSIIMTGEHFGRPVSPYYKSNSPLMDRNRRTAPGFMQRDDTKKRIIVALRKAAVETTPLNPNIIGSWIPDVKLNDAAWLLFTPHVEFTWLSDGDRRTMLLLVACSIETKEPNFTGE